MPTCQDDICTRDLFNGLGALRPWQLQEAQKTDALPLLATLKSVNYILACSKLWLLSCLLEVYHQVKLSKRIKSDNPVMGRFDSTQVSPSVIPVVNRAHIKMH